MSWGVYENAKDMEETRFIPYSIGEVAKIPRRTRYRPEINPDTGKFGIRVSFNGHRDFSYAKKIEYVLFIPDCRGGVVAGPTCDRRDARCVMQKEAD